jgi:hypothetical protein
MRLAQAPAQMVLVENSLGLFGQDLFASLAPLSRCEYPLLDPPTQRLQLPGRFFLLPQRI